MALETRNGGPGIMLVGIGAIGLFAIVSLVAWALGIRGLPDPADPTLGGDAAASLGRLANGGVQDTARVVRLGELGADLDESSGLAVSRSRPGVVWTHNDGDDGRLYAIRTNGTTVGSVGVEGADIEDWEDMALARCPSDGPPRVDCLYLGDFGDNDDERDRYAIDIFAEPDPEQGGAVRPLRRVWFRYPDGPADTEALAVLNGEQALVATKGNDGSSRLYRVSLGASDDGADDGVRAATLVGSLPVVVDGSRERITGAALSPDGSTLAVRNHHAVYLFDVQRPLGSPVLCEIGAWQPQGEGLDFIRADMLILTSEQDEGRAPIVRLRCP